MKRWFIRLLVALESAADSLGGINTALHGVVTDGSRGDGLEGRVSDLELRLDRQMAEAEALMLRAKGKFDAARAAEERARRLADSGSGLEDGDAFDEEEIRRAYEEAGFSLSDASSGPGEEVLPVHSRLDARRASKSNALQMKFGRGAGGL